MDQWITVCAIKLIYKYVNKNLGVSQAIKNVKTEAVTIVKPVCNDDTIYLHAGRKKTFQI